MVKLIVCIPVVFLLLNTCCSLKVLNKSNNQNYQKYLSRRSYEEKLRDDQNEENVKKSRVSNPENERAIKEFNEKVQFKNPDKND